MRKNQKGKKKTKKFNEVKNPTSFPQQRITQIYIPITQNKKIIQCSKKRTENK